LSRFAGRFFAGFVLEYEAPVRQDGLLMAARSTKQRAAGFIPADPHGGDKSRRSLPKFWRGEPS
jgi:hypothetical protein